MNIKQLEKQLNYSFKDSHLLLQALTHKSYGHEFCQKKPPALRDNERLEFLGDVVLALIVSDILFKCFPNLNEGQLSKMRASVVNEKTLAGLAETLKLFRYLRLGKGEVQTKGNQKPSILSSAFEALIGAIYLDGGYEEADKVIRPIFSKLFLEKHNDNSISFYDHKTRLQEIAQARWKTHPTYHTVGSCGPHHAKKFKIEVRVDNQILACALGSSKKEAEQKAAQEALLVLLN